MSAIISEGPLLVSLENGVKTVTFNQPEKRNAINSKMSTLFRDAVLSSEHDESRVILITGSGDHFCAGADLAPSSSSGEKFDVSQFLRSTYNPLVTAIRNMDKPFVAKVRGNCVGAGFSFALACDLLYASPEAKMSQIFTKIGLSSDGGGGYFLPEKIGYHKAFELMALHEMITADQAEKLGIVNKVVAADELDNYVDGIVDRLINGAYLAIQRTKSNLRAAMTQGLEAALEQEADNQGLNFKSKDFFEGVAAFLQKRKANFKGE